MLLTGCVAVFFGTREGFVFKHSAGYSDLILRTRLFSLMFATAASLYSCVQCRHDQRTWYRIFMPSVAGAIASGLVVFCLGVEVAEALRRMNYWSWSQDFGKLAFIVLGEALLGFVIAFEVAFVGIGVWRK